MKLYEITGRDKVVEYGTDPILTTYIPGKDEQEALSLFKWKYGIPVIRWCVIKLNYNGKSIKKDQSW